ncbi:MAG: hypothetical protein LUF29_09535 [Oscillospiraceae bacterium]|nr:hypothetical protein [Oscillospiraceae bacterium]
MNEIMVSQSAEIPKQVADTTANILTKGFDYVIDTISQSENISAIGKGVVISIVTAAFIKLSIYAGTKIYTMCAASIAFPQQ